MITKYALKSLFNYLITSNNLEFILEDLRKRMTQNSTVANIRFKISDEIVNGFAFDGYLYCLKCQISSFIHSKIHDHTLKDIKKKFEQLNQLAKTSDRNKFFIGKSSKMLELVEFLFNTSFEKNKNHPEIQGEILENKAKIIEK